MVPRAEKRTGEPHDSLLQRSRTGSSPRRYAVSQNYLFALIARKYVYFRQTALAWKGLEETEVLPAKRASEQSSIAHWTDFIDEISSPLHCSTKFIVSHRHCCNKITLFVLRDAHIWHAGLGGLPGGLQSSPGVPLPSPIACAGS
jgi:hypothetical protein